MNRFQIVSVTDNYASATQSDLTTTYTITWRRLSNDEEGSFTTGWVPITKPPYEEGQFTFFQPG
jgi:hypothetical protein